MIMEDKAQQGENDQEICLEKTVMKDEVYFELGLVKEEPISEKYDCFGPPEEDYIESIGLSMKQENNGFDECYLKEKEVNFISVGEESFLISETNKESARNSDLEQDNKENTDGLKNNGEIEIDYVIWNPQQGNEIDPLGPESDTRAIANNRTTATNLIPLRTDPLTLMALEADFRKYRSQQAVRDCSPLQNIEDSSNKSDGRNELCISSITSISVRNFESIYPLGVNDEGQTFVAENYTYVPTAEECLTVSEQLTKGRKKNFCLFCKKYILDFSRHIVRHHGNEEEVQKIIKQPPCARERKVLIAALRKKGYFEQCKKSIKVDDIRTTKKVLPCVYCYGFYVKNQLWRHRKRCLANPNVIKNVAGEILVSDCNVDENLKIKVFQHMRPDMVTLIVRKDVCICAYGAYLLKNHTNLKVPVISSRLRELARLLIEILSFEPKLNNFFEVLKPNYYDLLVKSTKSVAKYNPETKLYKSPNYTMNICKSLKGCCDVALNSMSEGQVFGKITISDEVETDLKALIKLLDLNWSNDIGIDCSTLSKSTKDVETLINGTKRKRVLVPWTDLQKAIIKDYFKEHIKNKRAPKKSECENLIKTNNGVFHNKSWLKIKVCVQNLYTKPHFQNNNYPSVVKTTQNDENIKENTVETIEYPSVVKTTQNDENIKENTVETIEYPSVVKTTQNDENIKENTVETIENVQITMETTGKKQITLEATEKKRILVKWTDAQKSLVKDFFKEHILTKRPPKKFECENLIEKYPEVFDNKSWLKIKVYIQNLYVKNKKKR